MHSLDRYLDRIVKERHGINGARCKKQLKELDRFSFVFRFFVYFCILYQLVHSLRTVR